ncbi:LigT-like protein [Ceratobasidium sp. AG-I]|nr:LigT-like protein [Ceratobasidium sp. AG-I]
MSDMGLSLWLVPSSDEHERLQPILDRLAKDAKGPAFQAHVTLISVHSSTPLPFPSLHFDKFPPLTLDCVNVQAGQTYFQSVLIAIGLSPELQALHDSVRQSLDKPLPAGVSFFPHLSLFYGGSSQEFKESLVRKLFEDGTAVHVDDGHGVTVAGLSKIHVNEVWLLRTEGPPEEWEVMEKWKLGAEGN